MKRRIIFYLILGVCVFAVLCGPGYRDIVTTVRQISDQPVILIDPGHGGMDGGAESSGGVSEKDINLDISLLLKKELQKQGMRVMMTREEDKGLYDESSGAAVRTLKTEDMKKRKRIIDETMPDLCVSVHMNSFTEDPGVRGAQVFYPSEGDEKLTACSKEAAAMMQKALNAGVNKAGSRSELGKNDVFLLRNITCPIIIVECGFLSNPGEVKKLSDSGYQRKISKVIAGSIAEYTQKDR